ncbi:YopX family protein [Bacillus subtilis]|uniref:YopX family protein n=1 Tax=Bacillus subtilis TaxID=1423 RepID=UPI00203C5114|nr:YopX family protein [Bacillus subtilis]MCM3190233.1 YopX family protein [Bacillus subtilis]
MREIKFRAWINEESSWHRDSGVDTPCMEYDFAFEEYMTVNQELYKMQAENHILMQYTGFKDKNDREIYEGDILRVWEEDEHVPNHDSGGGIIDFDIIEGFSQLGVVDFKGAWFTYETKKHQKGREVSIFAPLDFTNNFEVIGNIYENPELLEASHASK